MMLLHPVLILSFFSGGLTNVVDHFHRTCGQFFANGNSPTILSGPQYIQICQSFEGKYYYATLYDTKNKIPVYSAYRFKRNRCPRKEKKWCIEPQLDDKTKGHNMALESEGQYGHNQALSVDYKYSGYHKGHLAPVYHANSEEFAAATFTLTNAAPQHCSFNQGPWRKTEKHVAQILTSECPVPYKAFIVTGVVPGDIKIKGRVTVPRGSTKDIKWWAEEGERIGNDRS
ncbi:endonuclease domain-containing 1 protein-like [Xyrauchen texanus]|uniref:endonuclease domain-containing 1 protein-like n=1 Tax=Xyrauchen texanus TaxID=154827 RepID=UPI0022423E5E|nr:endonuclease domain-containing 1 protein-like [Xyrauchen texanus]